MSITRTTSRRARDINQRMSEEKPAIHYQDGYEELAHAVVLLAVKDYRKVLKILSVEPDHATGLKMKRSCECFFHSRWFAVLTGADPDLILERLQKEVSL